jgi:flagellar hook-basal body complex protein FliE
MSDNKNNSNVLPFKPKKNPGAKNNTAGTDLKGVTAGTMAFLLLLVVSFNFSLFQKEMEVEKQQKIQRGLASLSPVAKTDTKSQFEQLNKKMITEVAQRPTAADSLTFGPLAGKYSIVTDNGRVTQITLNSNSNGATMVRDRFEFIENNAAALAPGLNSIRKVSVRKSGQKKTEVYEVQTSAGHATFEFTMGKENQLLSLVVD